MFFVSRITSSASIGVTAPSDNVTNLHVFKLYALLSTSRVYGFDRFDGLKTVGFVVADTDTEAEHKIWQMYNDFGTDEYDLDDLVVWQPKNDESYREDYPDVMEIVY